MHYFRSDPLKATVPLLKVIVTFIFIVVLAFAYLSLTDPKGVVGLLLIAAILIGFILLVCAIIFAAVNSMLLCIGEEGLRQSFLGHDRQLIPWDSVSKIYKIAYFDTQRETNQEEFIVFPRSGGLYL